MAFENKMREVFQTAVGLYEIYNNEKKAHDQLLETYNDETKIHHEEVTALKKALEEKEETFVSELEEKMDQLTEERDDLKRKVRIGLDLLF
jgi:hypothetical protein